MSWATRCVGLAFLSSIWAGFIACGSSADAPPSSGGGAGGGVGATGGSSGGGGTGASSGSGGVDLDTGLNDVIDTDSACFGVAEKGLSTPLHLYVLMDRSSSLAGFKWDAAKAGITAFVSDPASDGIYVGLKFFPRAPDGTEVCSQQAYETPDTPFDLLPNNKDPIINAMNAATPSGFDTPVWPALGGGILESIQIEQNNAGHTAAVLLVTDGVPQGPATSCAGVDPTNTQEIAKLAATGVAFSPPVLTFVIGLPGVDQTFANTVAQAGGTTSAILVSSTNTQKEFQDALAKVRGQALPCEFQLPADVSSGKYDTGHVNVQLSTGGDGGTSTSLKNGDCAQGGDWSYDNAQNPTKIVLCPSVCQTVKQNYQSEVDIVLGCLTQVK